jgi:hypothetical protein
MKILFDQGTPLPLRRALSAHHVVTTEDAGWGKLSNGELIRAAEASFDLLITTDKNIKHQQNLAGRKLAILVLPTTSWPKIRQHLPLISEAVDSMKPGEYRDLELPS